MTEGISFSIADIPPTGNADDDPNPITSDDLTCEVCGTPLTYAGRGRKPRFCADHKPTAGARTASAPRSKGRDVDAAMAALETTHTSLSFILMLVAGDAAVVWENERNALNTRNRAILEADPKLAKKLATAASKGGGPALVLSHLIAIAPAAGITYAKVKTARDLKASQTPSDRAATVDNVVDLNMAPPAAPRPAPDPRDPDAIFNRR